MQAFYLEINLILVFQKTALALLTATRLRFNYNILTSKNGWN